MKTLVGVILAVLLPLGLEARLWGWQGDNGYDNSLDLSGDFYGMFDILEPYEGHKGARGWGLDNIASRYLQPVQPSIKHNRWEGINGLNLRGNPRNNWNLGVIDFDRNYPRTRKQLHEMPRLGFMSPLLHSLIKNHTIPRGSQDQPKDTTDYDDEAAAAVYMDKLDKALAVISNKRMLAEWQFVSNITQENDSNREKLGTVLAKEEKEHWEITSKYNWRNFEDETLKRKFSIFSNLGAASLPSDKFQQLTTVLTKMQNNYRNVRLCHYNNRTKCDMTMGPAVAKIFSENRDPETLKFIWNEWHQKAGAPSRKIYGDYVNLRNEAARANNITNYAEDWIREYGDDNFEAELAKLIDQIKPLYQQMHAFIRKRLWDQYGDKVLTRRGPIPAHLLGSMWGHSWLTLNSIITPYPDNPDLDITEDLVRNNYTAVKIFQTADEFFQSLNMTAVSDNFWKKSLLEKPTDRDALCQSVAYDFSDGEDFRISMCTEVNMEDFVTAHHEMGHIQYYMQYRNQPQAFRQGANPGFHEAVGDVIALSVSSIKHLRRIGFVPPGKGNDSEIQINQLFDMCLDRVAFLPFSYIVDTYRYSIFRGETSTKDYNCHYWNLREKIQGLEPPLIRTEDQMDAAAVFHVASDVEYARYFVSFIIQFQFHKALCEKAGEYVPGHPTKTLANCDIYNNANAGNALSEMLQMGISRPWQDAMEVLTGQRTMDAGAILEYFKPLQNWLEKENKKTGELIGWESGRVQYCTAEQKKRLPQTSSAKKG